MSGRCSPQRAAVWLPGSPGSISGHWRAQGAALVEIVSEVESAPLSISIARHDCPFVPYVVDSMHLYWRCLGPQRCTVWLEPRAGEIAGELAPLELICEDAAPVLDAPAALSVSSDELVSLQLSCADPDRDPLRWEVAPQDTCGGDLQVQDGRALYQAARLNAEAASCVAAISCSDGAITASAQVEVRRQNTAPRVYNVRGAVKRGEEGRVGYSVSDVDVPAQPLEITLSPWSCPFPIEHHPAQRQLSWRCEVEEPATCAIQITADDGQAQGSGQITMSCQ